MRLLNVRTKNLEEFLNRSIPKYAILSHTWGEGEIDGCCAQAIKHECDYVWIDTCCIDKSSSAELSEAINSMVTWYERADICYVYLSDVCPPELDLEDKNSAFSKSRWFTRGWTLQELLAPHSVEFFNSSWHPLGRLWKLRSRMLTVRDLKLLSYLGEITKIPSDIIQRETALNSASIAMKMSWASARQTTRVEDMAYCLLAYLTSRCQCYMAKELKLSCACRKRLSKTRMITPFLLGALAPSEEEPSCFASSPKEFAGCGDLVDYRAISAHSDHVLMTNRGLSIKMPIVQLTTGDYIGKVSAEISSRLVCLAIPLVRHSGDENAFYRSPLNVPQEVGWRTFGNVTPTPIHIIKKAPELFCWSAGIQLSQDFSRKFKVIEIHPPNWDLRIGHFYEGSETVFTKSRDETILLDCSNKRGEKFAIRIEYTFQIAYSNEFDPFLRPMAAKVWVSPPPFDHSCPLLDLIATKGEQIDDMMDWQEDMVLEQVDASCVDGEIHDSFTRRLHLDGSERNKWKIDIVDVFDYYIGEESARHSLVAEPCNSDDGTDYLYSDFSDSLNPEVEPST